MHGLSEQRGVSGAPIQLLVVSHTFPPDAQVGARRVVGLCRYLPAEHIQPIVLTLQEKYFDERDETFVIPSEIRVRRTAKMPDPLAGYTRAKSLLGFGRRDKETGARTDVASEPAGGPRWSLGYQARVLLDSYYLCWQWHVAPVRAGAALLKREPISAIFSSAPPWSSHLVALRLKRKFGLPWIADFRDAWTGDAWRRNDFPRWREAMDRRLEANCVRCADLIVCLTSPVREDFLRSYPNLAESKFVVLPNGFDDDGRLAQSTGNALAPFPTGPDNPNDLPKLLLHLGDLYLQRRIDTFCLAVENLVASGRLDSKAVRIVFQGGSEPPIIRAAERAAPGLVRDGRIEFRSRVPWRDGQQLLRTADLLLIFQGNHRTAVPAKFYEYLGTGKPVFAIVQKGALSEIVESTQSGVWADPRDPAEIADKLLEALRLPVRRPENAESFASPYHYRSLSAQLAKWIRALSSGKGMRV